LNNLHYPSESIHLWYLNLLFRTMPLHQLYGMFLFFNLCILIKQLLHCLILKKENYSHFLSYWILMKVRSMICPWSHQIFSYVKILLLSKFHLNCHTTSEISTLWSRELNHDIKVLALIQF
jgi:hypothetical protein